MTVNCAKADSVNHFNSHCPYQVMQASKRYTCRLTAIDYHLGPDAKRLAPYHHHTCELTIGHDMQMLNEEMHCRPQTNQTNVT